MELYSTHPIRLHVVSNTTLHEVELSASRSGRFKLC